MDSNPGNTTVRAPGVTRSGGRTSPSSSIQVDPVAVDSFARLVPLGILPLCIHLRARVPLDTCGSCRCAFICARGCPRPDKGGPGRCAFMCAPGATGDPAALHSFASSWCHLEMDVPYLGHGFVVIHMKRLRREEILMRSRSLICPA